MLLRWLLLRLLLHLLYGLLRLFVLLKLRLPPSLLFRLHLLLVLMHRLLLLHLLVLLLKLHQLFLLQLLLLPVVENLFLWIERLLPVELLLRSTSGPTGGRSNMPRRCSWCCYCSSACCGLRATAAAATAAARAEAPLC